MVRKVSINDVVRTLLFGWIVGLLAVPAAGEVRSATDPETGNTARSVELTSDTGYFWFFDEDNVEVVLKVLDACVLNDNFWLFAAGLTNVEVEIRVTDMVLGTERTFANPLGTPFAPIQETSLLPCG
jgi:hypothetical protein